MSAVQKCDVCGAVAPYPEFSAKMVTVLGTEWVYPPTYLIFVSRMDQKPTETYDLCEGCLGAVQALLEARRVKPGDGANGDR